MSHPLDDVVRQEIERKKVKRALETELKRTESLRRSIAQIASHYERPPKETGHE